MHAERPFLRLTPRTRGRSRSWEYYVLKPLVLLAVEPFVLAFKLFLGWWLGPLLNRHYEKELRQKVRTDLYFLFQDFDGRFVRNVRRDKSATIVTVETADLRVVISRHHGDYGIGVARRDRPENRESLDSILGAIYEREGSLHKPTYVNLADLGTLFREKFQQVQAALSGEHYPETLAAIDRRHQQEMESMAQAFNRPGGLFEADLVNPSDLTKGRSK